MIWLPRTTDNSTYFTQSLEIRGNESRLYIYINFRQKKENSKLFKNYLYVSVIRVAIYSLESAILAI